MTSGIEYKMWPVIKATIKRELEGNLERCAFLSGQTDFSSASLDETAYVSFETHIGVILRYSSGDTMKEQLACLFYLCETVQDELIYVFSLKILSTLHVDKNDDMIVTTECGPGITGSRAWFVVLISRVIGGGIMCAFILFPT